MDTAGLREGLEEAEQLGIARSREALADAALVLVVLDATQPLNDEERRLLAAVEGRPALIVVNKSDLAENALAPVEFAGFPALRTSALTGEGIAALRVRILELATGGAARSRACSPACAITRPSPLPCRTGRRRAGQRQQHSARDDPARPLSCLWALDSLTGQTTSDDILNLIFSTFCIGK